MELNEISTSRPPGTRRKPARICLQLRIRNREFTPVRKEPPTMKLISHPVHARRDRGNAAAYFQFLDLKALEAHVSELPAGAAARLHRHSCEALFYVLKGEGYTVIHKMGGKKRTIAWKEGDLFATPMSLWHQHFNASKRLVVRYLEITTIPLVKIFGGVVYRKQIR
jgi:mannose-6-phosphate isomerase-like protein (cupin superfamily)